MAQAGNYGSGNADKVHARTKKLRKTATGSRGASRSKPKVAPAARQYVSQGKAVEKVANQRNAQQRRARITRQHDVKDTKGSSDLQRAERFKQTPQYAKDYTSGLVAGAKTYTDKSLKGQKADWSDPRLQRLKKLKFIRNTHGYAAPGEALAPILQDKSGAPVAKVLEQTTRTLHAVAAPTKQIVEGHPEKAPSAALKGLRNKDKTTFSDVLASAGVKNKAVKAIAGTTLDIAGDPLSWTGAGLEVKAARSEAAAAAKAAAKAAKAGMSKEGIATVAKQAAKRAPKPEGKGIKVTLGGKRVPGVTPVTTGVNRVVSKATAGRLTKTRASLRKAGNDVRPMMRPNKEVSLEQHRAIRHAEARQRSVAHAQERRAQREATVLHKADLTPEEKAFIAKKIDLGPRHVRKIKDPRLKKVAQDLQAVYRGEGAARRKAGVVQGEIGRKRLSSAERSLQTKAGKTGSPQDVTKAIDEVMKAQEARAGKPGGYYPRELAPSGETELQKFTGTGAKPKTSMKRKDTRTLEQAQADRAAKGKQQFETTAELTRQNYGIATGRAVGRQELVQGTAKAGRALKAKTVVTKKVVNKGKPNERTVTKVKRVWENPKLQPHEALYELSTKQGRYDLRPVEKAKKGGKGGKQYIVLNKNAVENALRPAPGRGSDSELLRVFDKGTKGFKILATGTPGFHIRNLIGDTLMHQRAVGVRGFGKSYKQSAGLVKQQSKIETHAGLGAEHPPKPEGSINIGGVRTPVAQYLKELESNGITRGGQRAVDVKYTTEELAGKATPSKKVKTGTKAARVGRWMQNREDLARVATYTHYRNKGFSPAEARRKMVEGPHPDYADLSPAERNVLRRVAPFYTFSARSGPFHVKTLLTNPGRIAAYQKIIEESQKTFGGKPEDFSDFTQSMLPVNIPGEKGIHWSDPATILRVIPTTTNLNEYGKNLMDFTMSMVTPLIKDPVEYFNNYSFFLQQHLEESDRASLVPAPSFVQYMPDSATRSVSASCR